MTSRFFSSHVTATCALLLVPLLAGCGGQAGGRCAVSGTVSVAGAPLPDGNIVFIPLAPTKGPRVAARIAAGQFELDDDAGPIAGNFRVEVHATTPDVLAMQQGRRVQDIPPQAWSAYRDVHENFNRLSTLTTAISDSSPNELRFDVQWAAPMPAVR